MGEKIAPGSLAARELYTETEENYAKFLANLYANGIQLTDLEAATLQAYQQNVKGELKSGTPDKPLQ